jgi:ABC-type nitrate/sulfonate/bicarbonate transport system substrate-binding protein
LEEIMKKALIVLCLALAVSALAVAGGSSASGPQSKAPEKVEFLLNWRIEAIHSPYYIALKKAGIRMRDSM